MTYTFRPATRDAAKLLIGLAGPSGSGKTMSALRLATGLGGPIAFIDTEQGRATQYAGEFDFLHAVLPPPFSPDRYREIIDAAVATRPNVIVIDSMSHEWEGPGGILEMVDEVKEKRDGRGTDFSAWAGPKQSHQKLVNRLLQVPAHVILCMRAKEKRGLTPDPKRPGKTEVVNLGWHPIAEGGLTYELTISALLSSERKGVPIINGYDFGKLPGNMSHLFPLDEQISESTGQRMAAWAKGSEPEPRHPAKPAAIALLTEDGELAGEYATYSEWLAGLEMLVGESPGVVGANLAGLRTITTNRKAPAELKLRADALLSVHEAAKDS